MKTINPDQQINAAFNQQMYEFKYRYLGDKAGTIYTNWCTQSQFENCYKNTVVLSKTN